MDSGTDKPLITNTYPIVQESEEKLSVPQKSQPVVNNPNIPSQPVYYQYPNQGYIQPIYVQGYPQFSYLPNNHVLVLQQPQYIPPPQQPQPQQAYQPIVNQPQLVPPPAHQGYQPIVPGQVPPPPPPPTAGQIYINLPESITPSHPRYQFILEQLKLPCIMCSSRGTDRVDVKSGFTVFAWAIFLFIFTGVLCFWIPFVVDGCKDIKISCSRCGYTKTVIQADCC